MAGDAGDHVVDPLSVSVAAGVIVAQGDGQGVRHVVRFGQARQTFNSRRMVNWICSFDALPWPAIVFLTRDAV